MTDRSAPGGTQRVPVQTYLRARHTSSGQTLSRAGFGLVRALLFLTSLWLAGGSAALAAVPGAGSVSNQATVTFDSDAGRREAPTNTVITGLIPAPPPPPPPAACTPVLTPGGTVDAPAQTLSGAPGETVLVSYTLTQAGVGGVVNLELLILMGAPDATLFLDENGDGTLGEGEVGSLELAAGASVALLVQVTLGEPAPSEVYLEVIARCADETGVDRSVSLINVDTGPPPPPALLRTLIKDADPPSGSAVTPGQELRYTLSFTAGAEVLGSVSVSDSLNGALSDPALITDGTITDPATGLETTAVAAFDPATRTLSWTLAEVPALMTAVLEFSVTVADAAPPGPEPGPALPTLLKDAVPAPGTDVTPPQEITYTLTFSAGAEPLTGVQVSDTLAAALDGPVNVTDGTVTDPETGLSATAAATYDPATRELVWSFAEVPATMTVALSFTVTVAADATGVLTNQAELTTGGMTSLSSAVTHTVTTDAPTPPPSPEPCNVTVTPDGSEAAPGQQRATLSGTSRGVAAVAEDAAVTAIVANVFTERATLAGTAFIDENRNGALDGSDTLVEGLRLYLSNGQSFVTDSRGRYTFVNLTPGLAALRVDATTQPPFALQESVTQVGAGFWRLRLLSGLITRQDVAFVPPDVSSAVTQTLKLGDGPVTLGKTLNPLGDDRFEVTVTLSTTDALRGLSLTDTLPPGSSLVTPPQNPVTGALAPDLTLNLGDVPAGFETRAVYTVRRTPAPADTPASTPITTVPTLRWDEP